MNKIEHNLKKALRKKGFSSVEASVDNGVAHLAGRVATWDEVVTLGYCAAQVKGVTGVVNNVTLQQTEKLKEKKGEFEPFSARIQLPEKADVVIIGGGVIGCFVARELSRYDLNVVLVEKESDVACGATKANNGQIHTGIGEKSGTLKKRLCAESWPLYETLTKELDVPYTKNGLLIVLTKDTIPKVPSFISTFILKYVVQPLIVQRAKKVGDTPRVLNKKDLIQMEPHITDRAVSAVFLPGYGIICPYKLTIALAENAIENGATVLVNTQVIDIKTEDSRVRAVVTDRGEIKTDYVVNAAGVFADEVAKMAGAQEYTIHPRKGSIVLFDSVWEGYINHQVSELKIPQEAHTKGGGVLMTVDGNMLWGPTAAEVSDKEDTSVTCEEIEELMKKYQPVLPDFSTTSVITYFAGVRAATYTEDFVIKASSVKGVVHAAGIQSPGLTAAPKIAEMVVTILENLGLHLEKTEFDPVRRAPLSFKKASLKEKEALIKKNPLYGNIVCRCEQITEAEIVNAIHSPLPATTMDAVKRRTRAGMGRCQGGFCGPRVAEILARELAVPLLKVTKKGTGSPLFFRRTKVVL